MQDVTKLITVEFSDKFEVSASPKLNTGLRGRARFKNRGKTSKYSEKFRNTDFIRDTEQ